MRIKSKRQSNVRMTEPIMNVATPTRLSELGGETKKTSMYSPVPTKPAMMIPRMVSPRRLARRTSYNSIIKINQHKGKNQNQAWGRSSRNVGEKVSHWSRAAHR